MSYEQHRQIKKGDEIIGLHAMDYEEPYEFTLTHIDGSSEIIKTDFMELEKWGNEYNKNSEMIGRGSFRLFDLTIEHSAKAFEDEGWTRFEGPVQAENTKT